MFPCAFLKISPESVCNSLYIRFQQQIIIDFFSALHKEKNEFYVVFYIGGAQHALPSTGLSRPTHIFLHF
jgi:hypothetical protein